jgi:DNA-binding NarL/FixJ family response regulator
MTQPTNDGLYERCALVGIRHRGLSEGIRYLVATRFAPVVAVQSEESLAEIAERLHPLLAVVDLALGHGDGLGMIRRLHRSFPSLCLIVLSLHDSPEVERAVLVAGADRLVLAAVAATELLPAAEAVMDEKRALGERDHE